MIVVSAQQLRQSGVGVPLAASCRCGAVCPPAVVAKSLQLQAVSAQGAAAPAQFAGRERCGAGCLQQPHRG